MLDCPLHPDRNSGLKPTNGCLDCMQNYGRAQLKRRMTHQKNGGWNTVRHIERGECSVCRKMNVRLSSDKLSNGDEICETCEDVWQGADSRASASVWIREDMKEAGIPLVKGFGGE